MGATLPRVFLLLGLLLAATASSLPDIPLTLRGDVLRIAVAGDTGDGAETVARGIAAVHRALPLDAIILTGDNFYPCGVRSESDDRWSLITPLTTIGPPVFPVLGNHDYCGEADPKAQVRATGHVRNWHLPARQYMVHASLADFLFLDTTPFAKGYGNVSKVIRDAFAKPGAPWRIVVAHHPVLSSGYHGYFPRREVARLRALVPALEDVHADLYIAGHDHHLELIRGRSMLHLISGAGSSPIPPIRLRARTVFPAEIRLERIGFAVVEISRDAIRVRMYDGDGRPRSAWISGRVRRQAPAK